MDNTFAIALTWVGHIASIITLGGVIFGFLKWFGQNKRVEIIAVCGDKRRCIGKIPAKFASRSEISGFVAQNAKGPERLDLSGFGYDYDYLGNEIEVPLNETDFDRLK